jgi:hypothetical protein
MKIAILTFWNSNDNYGQILQGYALQSYLKKLGHNAYIVRYEESKTYPTIFQEKGLKPFIKRIIKWTLHNKDYKKQRNAYRKNCLRQFNLFKQRMVYSSQRYFSYNELMGNPPVADMYITGSDQVWGRIPTMAKEQPYFLKFGAKNVKRVAYAASIGSSDFFNTHPDVLKTLTKEIDHISIREHSKLQLFEKNNIAATWVLDPVFLLEKEDYLSLCDKQKTEKGIFIYAVNIENGSEIKIDELKQIARAKGMQLTATLSSGYFPFSECLGNDIKYIYPTIEEWIREINSAETVVTTSFHGVMLSIILHKDFVYLPLKSAFSKGNDRVTSLLDVLGLSNRVLQTSYSEILNKKICWDKVDEILNRKREISKEFLKECGC